MVRGRPSPHGDHRPGVAGDVVDPSNNALLPTLLRPETLVSGNSRIALNAGIGRQVGGPLGGLVLAAGHLRVIVIADAISFVAAGALIGALRPAAASADRPPATVDRAAARGFLAAVGSRAIRDGLLVTFIDQIAQGIFVVLFILFVACELRAGSSEIVLLRGALAIGAIGAGLGAQLHPHAPFSGAHRPRRADQARARRLKVGG